MITRQVITSSYSLVFCVVLCGSLFFFFFFFLLSLSVIPFTASEYHYDVSYCSLSRIQINDVLVVNIHGDGHTQNIGDVGPFKPPCVIGGASAINNSVYRSHQFLF